MKLRWLLILSWDNPARQAVVPVFRVAILLFMTPEQPSIIKRNLLLYGLLVMCGLMLAAVTLLIIVALPGYQQRDERRVAYAATATHIALPTEAVTPLPTETPLLTLVPLPTHQDLFILPTPTPGATLAPDQPPPATLFPQHSQYDLVNILVLGSDRRSVGESYRADVILIASINRTTQSVNVLSVPRDLYTYIPGWGMDRINTAELHQTQTRQTSHRLGLLAEAVEYNLGVQIDHLVRVDFEGFEQIVDLLGGIPVPVDCPVAGYQLVVTATPDEESSWQPFTLEPGYHQMDGAMALWYVRQRVDSSDFDRNRRQQIVLRALWRKLRQSDVMGNLGQLWDLFSASVETDLTLDEALSLAPLFLSIDATRIEGHFLGLDEVNLWQTSTGANVLVIDPVPFERTMLHFFTPPVDNRLVQEGASIEVLNASGILYADQLAAAQLQDRGLMAVAQGGTGIPVAETVVYDHTVQVKGSSLSTIQAALQIPDDAVIPAPGPGHVVDFTVVIGGDYQSCVTSPWIAFEQPE